jgi:hypothetical protein
MSGAPKDAYSPGTPHGRETQANLLSGVWRHGANYSAAALQDQEEAHGLSVMFAQGMSNRQAPWCPTTAETFPATVCKSQKNIQILPNENHKKEPRLCKHSGERDHQEKLNLSPQRAVQLLILPGGLG